MNTSSSLIWSFKSETYGIYTNVRTSFPEMTQSFSSKTSNGKEFVSTFLRQNVTKLNLFFCHYDSLEEQVMDLIYVTRTSNFRPHLRAWACTFRLKLLVKNARLLHVALVVGEF